MANSQRGETSIKLCGTDYTLRPTFGALCELEDRTGESVLSILTSMEGGKIRLRDLTYVIWAGMYGFDQVGALTISEVGELILEEGLVSVMKQENSEGFNVVSKFLVDGVLGGEEVKNDDAKKPVRRKKVKKTP